MKKARQLAPMDMMLGVGSHTPDPGMHLRPREG